MGDQVKIHICIPETGEKQKVIWLCPGMAGDDRYFLIGNEFGATHLICARSYDVAWEEWLDSQPAIADEHLYLAWGFESEEEYEFVSGLSGHKQGYYLRKLEVSEDGEWHLAEGYEYMPNSGGTNGIVSVGHYTWQREITHLLKRKGLPKKGGVYA